MAFTELEAHYNKFNEDKRLLRRRGQVEFRTSMKYIHEYLELIKSENGIEKNEDLKILDIGAGTGRYSIEFANEGYDVSAVELVKHNLGVMKAKSDKVKAFLGNALNLKRFEDGEFDATLLFGPMYHLYNFEDKLKALNEAKRVTKKGGIIFVAYLMNEYGVITYGFKEGNFSECVKDGRLNEDFHCVSTPKDLYDYMRLEDIAALNEAADLKREKIVAADGPADYLRPVINAMSEEEFEMFIKYHLSTCERMDLMGASAHTVDILRKI